MQLQITETYDSYRSQNLNQPTPDPKPSFTDGIHIIHSGKRDLEQKWAFKSFIAQRSEVAASAICIWNWSVIDKKIEGEKIKHLISRSAEITK